MSDWFVCDKCGWNTDSPEHSLGCITTRRRPTWDETFLEMAKLSSKRGTCPRAKVGGVVTRENRLLAAGYNGAPSGMPHCFDVGCDKYYTMTGQTSYLSARAFGADLDGYFTKEVPTTHCRRSIHAEQNIIGLAAKIGISLAGSTWYLWPFGPCRSCELLLLTVDAKRVVFPKSDATSGEHGGLLREAGVQVDVI